MSNEKRYLETFLAPVRKCGSYRPKFGQGSGQGGVSLSEFRRLYGADPFYAWIGLDSDLMYAAHRVAGGMTSIYRQIGVGCEHLLRAILVDAAEYADAKFAAWSYAAKTQSGKPKRLSLDGRIELAEVNNKDVLRHAQQWIADCCANLGAGGTPVKGVVFEVRQGYKSKDAKRQNADIDNATVAWANGYLPVFAVFSAQIDSDLVLRYRNNRCGILIGIESGDAQESLYAFCKQVLGYDLAGFFKSHQRRIKAEIRGTLQTLLGAGR